MNKYYVENLIKTAILEDCPYIDLTTDNTIEPESVSTARLIAKADGIIAGLDIALRVFTMLDEKCRTDALTADGTYVKEGEALASIRGRTRDLLKGERTALNILQHMSGVATATHALVREIEGTNARIVDTRKTLPGLRPIEKYAVCCGGGKNHRFSLSDAVMLKDNHIDASGGIESSVSRLRERLGHTVKIEVETRNLDEVEQAVSSGADIIMLDNMTPEVMKDAVALVGGRALCEASGNVELHNVRQIAETGVDIISVGAVTHSVTALDISMRF